MSEDQWKTKKELLQEMIARAITPIDLKTAFTELEYESKSELINDLEFVSKHFSKMGQTLLVSPAECSYCNFKFGIKEQKVSIPSKCPKCKKQLIIWPMVILKK